MASSRWIGLCLTGLLLCAPDARAFNIAEDLDGWDGKHQGFLLGFGAGWGGLGFQSRQRSGDAVTEQPWAYRGGVDWDLRLGYGLGEHWALYYRENLVTILPDGQPKDLNGWTENGPDETRTLARMLGLAWFGRERARGLFVTTGIGASTWGWDYGGAYSGPALSAGGGYEFLDHWLVEGSMFWGFSSVERDGGARTFYSHNLGLFVTVSMLIY